MSSALMKCRIPFIYICRGNIYVKMVEEKLGTFEQFSAGPTYVVIAGTGNVQETGRVFVLPWTDASGDRCAQATRLLRMIQDVGPMQARLLLADEWLAAVQQYHMRAESMSLTIPEMVGAQEICLYDGGYEVYVQRFEGYAPQREYISPGVWIDPNAQKYYLKNAIMDSVYVYGAIVNHVVLVK